MSGKCPNICQILGLLLVAVQLALLILWTSHRFTRASVPAAALSFMASFTVFVLSRLEHGRGIRPSTLLNLYLLTSLLFDAIQVRTLYLRHDDPAILSLVTANVGIKTVLLLLEAKTKRGCLRAPFNKFSPEATSGIFSHSFFWWLNPVLLKGFRTVLTLDDLFTTDQALLSEFLQCDMQTSWDRCKIFVFDIVRTDDIQMLRPRNMALSKQSSTVLDGLLRL